MSFGLGRGRELLAGEVGVLQENLPALPDGVFAPRAGDAARALGWLDPRAWFARPEAPLEVEIGSGKGTFILEEATRRPETNFLGFEWAREFYLYAADRCRRRGLTNVRIVNGDATEFLHWRMPPGVAEVIHLYFSDPWPKQRHHKRRVVQDRFLADAHRALVDGGELRIVTDHADYWAWMEEHFARWCSGEGVEGRRFEHVPFDAAHRPGGAGAGELVGTNFERKYAREGRPFNAAVLRKAPARPEGRA